MNGRLIVGIGVLFMAPAILAPPAQADSIEVLMEKRTRKSTTVLILRQGFDTLRGFDLYFLETFSSPDRKMLSERQLAKKRRSVLVKQGQFELYMKKVEAAKAKALRRLEKKGFKPVCRLVRLDVPSVGKVALPAGDKELSLYVDKGGKGDRLVLAAPGGKKKTLKRFKKPKKPKKKKSPPYVAHRGIMEVSLVRGGKTLAVVVRKQTLPSPEYISDDDLFLIPLRRPLKRLGVDYPLACPQPESGEEQSP